MKNCRSILFTAAEGGCGTSFTAANTALALARSGRRVLLLDASPVCRVLDGFFGRAEEVLYDLSDLWTERAALPRAALSLTGAEPGELFLLPAAFRAEELPCMSDLLAKIEGALEKFSIDDLVVDALATPDVCAASPLFDRVCLVSAPREPSCRKTAQVAQSMRRAGGERLSLVIDRFCLGREAEENGQPKAIALLDAAALPLLALIPPTGKLARKKGEVAEGGPLHADDRAARTCPAYPAFCNLIARLGGEERPLLQGVCREANRLRLLY